MFRTLLLLAATAVLSWPQTYSTPMRDVENPDKNLVSAVCQFDFASGSGNQSGNCQAVFPGAKPIVLTSVDAACHSDAVTDRFRRAGSLWSVTTGNTGLFGPTAGIGGSLAAPTISDVVEQGANLTGLRILVKPQSGGGSPYVALNVVIVRPTFTVAGSRCVLHAYGYVAP